VLKVPTKKRKSRKQRGSRYCGWGQVGQHRKAGARGGKGKAGGRKHFWIYTIKYNKNRYRNIGFKHPSSLGSDPEIINVGELEHLARQIHGDYYLNGFEELNLTSMGINKILGRGKITTPLKIKVAEASMVAQEKIEEVGGSIEDS
jgi:large subunit ribosomal protein L15